MALSVEEKAQIVNEYKQALRRTRAGSRKLEA